MHWEHRLRLLAAQQEGLVARFHLPALGCGRETWYRAAAAEAWDLISPRVLRSTSAPPSDAQRALAAVLDASPGAVLHGPSTLAWYGLTGYDLASVHVARIRGQSGKRPVLGRLHELRDLAPRHVSVVRGVPTEVPLRAIWAEAAEYSPEPLFERGCRRIGRLLDRAHRQGLVTWQALDAMVTDLQRRGRAGTRIMRTLSLERPAGSSPIESRNESRLEEILEASARPGLRRQVWIGGDSPIGRIDFRDEELPLAVEVNSITFHTAPSDRAADELRYRRLNEVGLTVVVIWEDDLWGHPTAVARSIDQGRAIAGSDEPPAVLHSPSCPWLP